MAYKIIEELIDGAKTCVMSSIDHNLFPNTRAMMGIRKRNDLNEIFFATNTSSNKVSQFNANSKACLYFFDDSQFIGCMFKGNMEVLCDIESKKSVWRKGDELYWPKGINDPDFCVLKFSTQSIRVYKDFVSEDIDM